MIILWYMITGIVSLAGAAWLMNSMAWFISENEPPPQFEQFSEWLLDKEQWYMNTDFGTKLLVAGIMTLIVLLLPLSCRLDEHLRQLPSGQFFEEHIGESIFEDYWIFRLLPCMIFFAYIVVRIICMIFLSQADFTIHTFSLTGENYSLFQWITQGTYFLILAVTLFLVWDSFLSAGLIGAIPHIIAVLTANMTGFVLAFAVIITLLQALPTAIGVLIVIGVIVGVFTASYKVVYIYV